ncbi:hypothetical protein H5A43_13580 [Pectobacterium brasiliense]|nr:hypothetical protein [Pectobacterium brasiliense]
MTDINNDIYLTSADMSGAERYEHNDTESNGELASLTQALGAICNTKHELNKGSTLSTNLNQAWQRLWTAYNEGASQKDSDNEAGIKLQEILTEGENLHRLADSLQYPVDEAPVPGPWKGSFLKRCLVGAGILSGIGASVSSGYWYYTGRSASTTGPAGNTTAYPFGVSVKPVVSHPGSVEDSFGNHSLHHDNPANRTRKSRRHFLPKALSTPQPVNSHDDVKIEPVKICYEYSGKGRAGSKRQVPCANVLMTKRPITNKPSYPYIYTANQPQKCKTQNQEQKCQKTHRNYHKKHPDTKLNNLILNVGKTPCYCPPPEGDNVRLNLPQLQKNKAQPTPRKIPANKTQLHTSATPTVSNTDKSTFISSIEKAARQHQEPAFISPPQKRLNILPDLDKKPALADTASSVILPDEDVKIEELYDFSCIDERNNMSLAGIIRQVGQTLRSPVQSLARESQVIHHHNTLRKGCPSADESQHLQEITRRVDAILSQVISLVPGANRVVVLQSIVGPALEIFADDLDQKPLDKQKVDDINQQVLFISRQTIPTLRSKDISRIYDKNPDKKEAKKKPPQRNLFKLKDDCLYITLEDKDYKVIHDVTSEYFFIEKEGQARRIYFNNHDNNWKEFNRKDILHYSQQQSLKNYGTKLKDFSQINNAEINLDKSNPEILLIKYNNIISRQVVINGFLVPVEEVKFDNGITTTVAVGSKVTSKKILIQSDYGWQFERDSTSMDKNLILILDSIKDTGVEYAEDNRFTCIKSDALSYDNLGGAYLKYEGKYYKVNSIAPSIYSLNEAPGNYFSLSDEILKIKKSSEILDSSEKVFAGIPQQGTNDIYLENWSYYTIIEQGVRVLDTESVLKIGPGIFVDKKNRFLFSINDMFFLVKRYTGNEIELESNIQGGRGIKIFRIDDIFMKVRNEDVPTIKYKEILGCRSVRSLTLSGIGCSAVWMEEDLHFLFKKSISSQSYARKKVTDNSIVNSKDEGFPNLFHSVDSGKLYLLHDGHYFNAEWVSTNDESNPTGKPVLNIYASGNFFRNKRLIATIISEKKDSKLEIKTISGFISEKINVKKNIAQAYINSRKYKNISNIKNIEGAIEQLNISGNTAFPKINSEFTPDVDETTLPKLIKKKLFPSRIVDDNSYTVKVVKLNELDTIEPLPLREAASKMRVYVDFIKKSILISVVLEISEGNQKYADYVGEIFNTDDVGFIFGFLNEISKRIHSLSLNLSKDNVYICDLYRKKIDGVNPHGEIIQSEIKEKLLTEERKEGTFAFATTDKSKRIFISIDKLYFSDPTSLDASLRKDPEMDLITTLLHEASHINGMTTDYVYFPRENGKMPPVLDCIKSMAQKIKEGQIKDLKGFKKMSIDYINSIPLLKNSFSNPLKMDELYYLMSYDKGYLAHLFLNTADGIALLIQDLYKIAEPEN